MIITKTVKKKDLFKMNGLIYGNPKVGKTTFAGSLPHHLFLATEEGLNSQEGKFKVQVKKWDDFKDVVKSLAKQPTESKTFSVYDDETGEEIKDERHEVKVVVIDTVDLLHAVCTSFINDKQSIEHESDSDGGKGYHLIKREFIKYINGLNQMGYGIWFISHSKEREVKTKTEKWTAMGTSMSASVEKMVAGMCDFIFYCYVNEKGERVMRTKPTKYVLAGDRDGRLPEIMAMDFNLVQNELKK